MNIKSFLSFLFVLVIVSACNFSTSKPKDGSVGISTSEKGLSAGRVYIANGQEETDNRIFQYGQKVYTNFVDMDGFATEEGMIYPQMAMYVLSKKGDTIMQQHNLFGEPSIGIDASAPSINGNIILARPIYSNATYSLHYHINDTKGDASMSSTMDFELVPDSKIKVVSDGLTYSEAYIYSEDKDEVITDGKFSFFENLRFDIQDLDGYIVKDGAINLGMNVKVIDDNDNEILTMTDVLKDPLFDESLLKQGVAATLIVKEGRVANPLKWQVKLWDKNSNAKLRAQAVIAVKN